MVKISSLSLIDDSQLYVWICDLTTNILAVFTIDLIDSIFSFK